MHAVTWRREAGYGKVSPIYSIQAQTLRFAGGYRTSSASLPEKRQAILPPFLALRLKKKKNAKKKSNLRHQRQNEFFESGHGVRHGLVVERYQRVRRSWRVRKEARNEQLQERAARVSDPHHRQGSVFGGKRNRRLLETIQDTVAYLCWRQGAKAWSGSLGGALASHAKKGCKGCWSVSRRRTAD